MTAVVLIHRHSDDYMQLSSFFLLCGESMYFDLRGELSFINVTLNVSDCDVTSTTRNTNKNASSAEESAKEESESLLLQRNVTRILCKFN